MADRYDLSDLKLEVGLVKKDIQLINDSLNKLEETMEKMQQQAETRRTEFQTDIKELHSRITTTNRELTDKLDESENKIMAEIKSLRDCIMQAQKPKEESKGSIKERLAALEKWQWMLIGGIALFSFIIGHVNLSALSNLFK